jgi:carbonic anhydrase/acetyltransferase-like protein (isoleucine patch superfamily)
VIYQLEERRVRATGAHFIADSASLIGTVVLENNATIWFNAVLRGDYEPITVGENSNVQDCCVLHTDPGFPLVIGANVTVGHKVCLHGCVIGDNSLIGINAVILSGAVIGRNCLIGANTLIPEGKQIPDNSLVMGTPGKVVRRIEGDQVDELTASAARYVANGKRYREQLCVQDEVSP